MNRDPRGAYLGCERCGGWEFVSYTCLGNCVVHGWTFYTSDYAQDIRRDQPHVHHELCPDCSADQGYHPNWVSEVPRSQDELQHQLVEIHLKEQTR